MKLTRKCSIEKTGDVMEVNNINNLMVTVSYQDNGAADFKTMVDLKSGNAESKIVCPNNDFILDNLGDDCMPKIISVFSLAPGVNCSKNLTEDADNTALPLKTLVDDNIVQQDEALSVANALLFDEATLNAYGDNSQSLEDANSGNIYYEPASNTVKYDALQGNVTLEAEENASSEDIFSNCQLLNYFDRDEEDLPSNTIYDHKDTNSDNICYEPASKTVKYDTAQGYATLEAPNNVSNEDIISDSKFLNSFGSPEMEIPCSTKYKKRKVVSKLKVNKVSNNSTNTDASSFSVNARNSPTAFLQNKSTENPNVFLHMKDISKVKRTIKNCGSSFFKVRSNKDDIAAVRLQCETFHLQDGGTRFDKSVQITTYKRKLKTSHNNIKESEEETETIGSVVSETMLSSSDVNTVEKSDEEDTQDESRFTVRENNISRLKDLIKLQEDRLEKLKMKRKEPSTEEGQIKKSKLLEGKEDKFENVEKPESIKQLSIDSLEKTSVKAQVGDTVSKNRKSVNRNGHTGSFTFVKSTGEKNPKSLDVILSTVSDQINTPLCQHNTTNPNTAIQNTAIKTLMNGNCSVQLSTKLTPITSVVKITSNYVSSNGVSSQSKIEASCSPTYNIKTPKSSTENISSNLSQKTADQNLQISVPSSSFSSAQVSLLHAPLTGKVQNTSVSSSLLPITASPSQLSLLEAPLSGRADAVKGNIPATTVETVQASPKSSTGTICRSVVSPEKKIVMSLNGQNIVINYTAPSVDQSYLQFPLYPANGKTVENTVSSPTISINKNSTSNNVSAAEILLQPPSHPVVASVPTNSFNVSASKTLLQKPSNTVIGSTPTNYCNVSTFTALNQKLPNIGTVPLSVKNISPLKVSSFQTVSNIQAVSTKQTAVTSKLLPLESQGTLNQNWIKLPLSSKDKSIGKQLPVKTITNTEAAVANLGRNGSSLKTLPVINSTVPMMQRMVLLQQPTGQFMLVPLPDQNFPESYLHRPRLQLISPSFPTASTPVSSITSPNRALKLSMKPPTTTPSNSIPSLKLSISSVTQSPKPSYLTPRSSVVGTGSRLFQQSRPVGPTLNPQAVFQHPLPVLRNMRNVAPTIRSVIPSSPPKLQPVISVPTVHPGSHTSSLKNDSKKSLVSLVEPCKLPNIQDNVINVTQQKEIVTQTSTCLSQCVSITTVSKENIDKIVNTENVNLNFNPVIISGSNNVTVSEKKVNPAAIPSFNFLTVTGSPPCSNIPSTSTPSGIVVATSNCASSVGIPAVNTTIELAHSTKDSFSSLVATSTNSTNSIGSKDSSCTTVARKIPVQLGVTEKLFTLVNLKRQKTVCCIPKADDVKTLKMIGLDEVVNSLVCEPTKETNTKNVRGE